jgi:peptidoglycan/LPS O-acetylase OafA/YrhL
MLRALGPKVRGDNLRFDAKLPYKHDYLLILRGLLAFFIVMHHWNYRQVWTAATGIPLFRYLVPDGALIVSIFFALSGYLMCKIIETQYAGSLRGILRFFYHRVLRIFPVYYVSVLLLAWVVPESNIPARFPLLFFYGNYAGGLRENPPLWSICVEVQFYFLAPWIYLWVNRQRVRSRRDCLLIAAFFLALNFISREMYWLYCPNRPQIHETLEVNLVYFMAGWLAYLFRDRLPKLRVSAAFSGLMALLFFEWIWEIHYRHVGLYGAFGNPVWCFLFPTLIPFALFFLIPPLDRPVRAHRFLGFILETGIFLGLISYSSYVLHSFFPRLLETIQRNLRLPFALPTLISLLAVCYLVHILIEKPVSKIKMPRTRDTRRPDTP